MCGGSGISKMGGLGPTSHVVVTFAVHVLVFVLCCHCKYY